MSYLKELEKYYFEQTGNDLSFFDNHSIPRSELSSLALYYDYCSCNSEETIRSFIIDYRKAGKYWDSLYIHLRKFYDFYVTIWNDVSHKYFFELCANVYLDEYKIQASLSNYVTQLFDTHIPNTTFIDLISGFNFTNFYDVLDKNILYYLVDKSIMACTCLEIAKKRKNIDNVVILNDDIKNIEKSQIEGNVSIVRASNPWKYVTTFQDYVEKYKAMIMPGGIFLFQEYSEHRLLFQESNPYKQNNIASYFRGWEEHFVINLDNKRIFDSLIYKRP